MDNSVKRLIGSVHLKPVGRKYMALSALHVGGNSAISSDLLPPRSTGLSEKSRMIVSSPACPFKIGWGEYSLENRLLRGEAEERNPVSFQLPLRLKRYLFAIISRVGMAAYSRFPVFGSFRASLAVIRDADRVLVIDRSDGRGLSFPGGLAYPWETSEQTLVREISEETGLSVKGASPMFSYYASDELPCRITVFAVEAEGKLSDSWEGAPTWLTVNEIRPAVIKSQQKIAEQLV